MYQNDVAQERKKKEKLHHRAKMMADIQQNLKEFFATALET